MHVVIVAICQRLRLQIEPCANGANWQTLTNIAICYFVAKITQISEVISNSENVRQRLTAIKIKLHVIPLRDCVVDVEILSFSNAQRKR